jgi:hypothetical protein
VAEAVWACDTAGTAATANAASPSASFFIDLLLGVGTEIRLSSVGRDGRGRRARRMATGVPRHD